MERTTVPAGSMPAKAVPAKTGAAKTVPAKTVPARTAPSQAVPAGRRRHPDEMRPGMMTDAEIKAELQTAAGDRRAALQAEREERRAYRATMFPRDRGRG